MWGSNGENQLPQIKELELQQPHPIPHIHHQVSHIKHLIGSNYHLVWGAENILRRSVGIREQQYELQLQPSSATQLLHHRLRPETGLVWTVGSDFSGCSLFSLQSSL